MTTAERWADVPAGCICKWAGTPSGWALTGPHPACPEVHDDLP